MLKKETISIQQKLAEFCRTGEEVSLEGSLAHRLPHYRRLVYNVMYGLLEKAFPIIKSTLLEAEFKGLVDAYLIKHDAQEPQVWKVPGEFYGFLKGLKHPVLQAHPYLIDLALLEWTEILLFNQEEKNVKPFLKGEFSKTDALVLNPDYTVLSFTYPVHKGDYDNIDNKKGSFYLLGFRNNETKKVHLLEVSILHNQLISMLETSMTIEDALEKSANDYQLANNLELEKSVMGFLHKLKEQGFVLGRLS